MRRMLSQRNGRVWTGAAIVAALAVGVVLGSSFASRSEAAAQLPSLTFSGQAGLVMNYVNAAGAADFERVMQAYRASLAGSDDAQHQRMAAGMRMYRAAEPGPNNTVAYCLFLDTVEAGGNYEVIAVLAPLLAPGPPSNGDEVRELYASFNTALQGGGRLPMNLTLVSGF